MDKRMKRLGSAIVLAGLVWLTAGGTFRGRSPSFPPGAAAQGTLTPPAGQPRATAPGGLRGRSFRRTIRPHLRHRRR